MNDRVFACEDACSRSRSHQNICIGHCVFQLLKATAEEKDKGVKSASEDGKFNTEDGRHGRLVEMAFYELKSKINSLEEELSKVKDENLRLIDERQNAESNESKYRKKYNRAKENLTKMTKRSAEIQNQLLLVNVEHDKLKEEHSSLEEEYASDLERCEKIIKSLKVEIYESRKKIEDLRSNR